jgi:AraC-like DNA-binding protein
MGKPLPAARNRFPAWIDKNPDWIDSGAEYRRLPFVSSAIATMRYEKANMLEFSTANLPPAERFDAFQEFIMRLSRTDTMRLEDPAAQSFHAHVSVTPLGHISFSTLTGTPLRYWCLPGSERYRPDYLRLMVNRAGPAVVSQLDQDASFTETGATIFDNRACGATHYAGTYTTYAYNVPRNLMLAAAPNAEDYRARPVRADPRLLRYLVDYTDMVLASSALRDPALALNIGNHLFDLAATLLGPTRDAAEIASTRGLRTTRLRAILAEIDRHFADPNLSAQTIAERHGLSRRQVERLMEENGETVSRAVLRRRLAEAAAMLSDPDTRDMRISDIAFACGFGELSHFNRSFKREYGEAPRLFRK